MRPQFALRLVRLLLALTLAAPLLPAVEWVGPLPVAQAGQPTDPTRLVSIASGPAVPTGNSGSTFANGSLALSTNGRYVAFESTAPNLA